MNTMLIIGNIISFVAACFTAAASIVKVKEKIFLMQFFQCLILALANLFFSSYAGIVVLLLCATRSLLVAKNHYTKNVCIIFCIVCTAAGIAVNNRGWVGMIIVIATLIYSIFSYTAKRELTLKANIAFNLFLWIIYEILITDISSLVADTIVLVITVVAMVKCVKAERNRMEHET